MTLRAFTMALAVSAGLLVPATAEAGHRHDRHCHHGRRGAVVYYESSPRYAPRYRERSYYYDDYAPRYRRGYDYDRRYSPRASFHYHGGRRCSRSHVGLYLGF